MNATILLIITLILALITAGMAVYNFIWIRRLYDLRTEFSSDNHPENLEEIVSSIVKKIKLLEQKTSVQDESLMALDENLSRAVQKVGVHRFNALADEGGNLSFSIALLDRNNTGLVITSMHGRQQNRVYSKGVEQGFSNVQLSEEEQKAIQNANTISNN